MAHGPAAKAARLLALTTTSSYFHRRRTLLLHRPCALVLIAVGALILAVNVFLDRLDTFPVPDHVANSPTDAHGPLDTGLPLLATTASVPPPEFQGADAAVSALAAAPRVRPPHGFEAFFAFAHARRCLVDAYGGVYADFAPFWQAERLAPGWFRARVREVAERWRSRSGTGWCTARPIKCPTLTGTERGRLISSRFPPLTVLINSRDEPRVAFDALPLFQTQPSHSTFASASASASISTSNANTANTNANSTGTGNVLPSPTSDLAALGLTLTDPTPFALAPPSATAFFAPRKGCAPAPGVGVAGDVLFLVSAASTEFTTDFVPVLSMAKPANGAGVTARAGFGLGALSETASEAAAGVTVAAPTCFADVLVPAPTRGGGGGRFTYPDNVAWGDKKGVLCKWFSLFSFLASDSRTPPTGTPPHADWRGKFNGGNVRGTNYRSFPRFRLLVRITGLIPGQCTGALPESSFAQCHNVVRGQMKRAADAMVGMREEIYGFKYLLDVDGNTFSGPYLNLLRSGGLVFKSTAFTELFTPWLVPYVHFIPVRPDLEDLPVKIEWARRIQEAGRVFAERVLTDAQNDCYWLLNFFGLRGIDLKYMPEHLSAATHGSGTT
ncbi:hypothetical protein DFH09DRAFT_1440296 [Mycena vulgaris]|nr:hypothetical protein DFH09DRAFT_1440296 [Mycena vulgaris]